MKEAEILFQVSQIVSATDSFTSAVKQIRSLLELALGAQALTLLGASDLPGRVSSKRAFSKVDAVTPQVEEFLESLDLPYRSLYSVPLRAGGKELGKLIACYASPEFHADVPRRVSNYVGEQLGMLLQRTRLGQDRSRLEAELAALRDDLAMRKAVHRAQGILVTRRGMTPASAKLWISQQARLARLTAQQVAEQVVAMEIAQRESFFMQSRPRRIA
jgi:GAF domain-containing protein